MPFSWSYVAFSSPFGGHVHGIRAHSFRIFFAFLGGVSSVASFSAPDRVDGGVDGGVD